MWHYHRRYKSIYIVGDETKKNEKLFLHSSAGKNESMTKEKKQNTIIPIVPVEETDHWIVVPGTRLEGQRRRIKEVPRGLRNCHFAAGVPKSINEFIYRAVARLGLGEEKLIFSRGVVRNRTGRVKNAVSICPLDWDVGTLITIPRALKYSETITLSIDSERHRLRLMEIVVLHGLLRLAFPEKGHRYWADMAALVLVRGFKSLESSEMPEILQIN